MQVHKAVIVRRHGLHRVKGFLNGRLAEMPEKVTVRGENRELFWNRGSK
jgi:hypothetical protein